MEWFSLKTEYSCMPESDRIDSALYYMLYVIRLTVQQCTDYYYYNSLPHYSPHDFH